MPQMTVPCVVYRGGTSRGVFFHGKDLPTDPEERRRIFLHAVDCWNPSQVDGLGAGTSHTSKCVVMAPSAREGVHANYTFVQVGIGVPVADTAGTCGNLMSAAGAFAVDEGLVPVSPGQESAEVVVYDTNIDRTLRIHVPLENGKARTDGSFLMPGLVRPGARIRISILNPGGGKTGSSLPLGARAHLRVGKDVFEITLADIVNPIVFVEADAFGLDGTETNTAISSRGGLLEMLNSIRDQAAVSLGWAKSPEEARKTTSAVPKIALVAPPRDYVTDSGERIRAEDIDVLARMLSLGRVHRTFAASALYCLAATCLLEGTIPFRTARGNCGARERLFRLGHPGGVAEIRVGLTADGKDVAFVGMDRTARRILAGNLCIPEETVA